MENSVLTTRATDNKPKAWKATTVWEQQLNDLVYSLPEDGNPRFRHYEWRRVFDEQGLKSNPLQALRDTLVTTDRLTRFSLPLGEDRIPFTVWLSDEALWNRLTTLSQIAILKDDDRVQVRAKFDEIVKGSSVERNEKGEIAVHGFTYYAWTNRQ